MLSLKIRLSRSALATGLAVVVGSAAPATVSETPTAMPFDSELTLGDVGVACTGAGQSKEKERWLAYPIKIEFVDAKGADLADATVTLFDEGAPLLTVACKGSWILLNLPDHRPYRLVARPTGRSTAALSAMVAWPTQGRSRVVFRFARKR